MTEATMKFLETFHLDIDLPQDNVTQEKLVDALLSQLPPKDYPEQFLEKQNRVLQERLKHRGVISLEELTPIQPNIYLWQGDITRLKVDAVVNAANSQLLGCFIPNHACIDNAIHCQAGIQLRQACHKLMQQQGHPETTGQAKLTPGFNLPAKFVLHTVGPIIRQKVTLQNINDLVSSYQSCLQLAVDNGLNSIAFCCISTGEFHFPNDLAAKLAVKTVKSFLTTHPDLTVIFNVFKDLDNQLYQALLSKG